MIPIRWENQGVCTWAILLDGSDDPPVLVDVDSGGTTWQRLARNLSTYVYSCVWDYHVVLRRPALVQAQNGPISPAVAPGSGGAVRRGAEDIRLAGQRAVSFRRESARDSHLVIGGSGGLVRGAADAASLEAAMRLVWELDAVGESLYAGSTIGGEILTRLRAELS